MFINGYERRHNTNTPLGKITLHNDVVGGDNSQPSHKHSTTANEINGKWGESKQLSVDGRLKMLTFSENKLRNSIKNAIRPEESVYKDVDTLLLNALCKPL